MPPYNLRIRPDILKESFKSEFVDNKFVLEQLSEHIKDCSIQWIQSNIFAPITIICQSSGYGKTKSLFEYSKEHITLFICIRNFNDNGYPGRSAIADNLINSIKDGCVDYFLGKYVLTALQFIEQIIKQLTSAKQLTIAKQSTRANKPKMREIALEFQNCQPWIYQPKNNDNVLIDKFYNEFNKDCSTANNNFTIDVKKQLNTHFKKDSPLTVVIDEAHVLTELQKEIRTNVEEDSVTYFRILRRSIIELFRDSPIVFVMTSTYTSIGDFNIGRNYLTISSRTTKKQNHKPFCQLVHCNALKSTVYEEQLETFYRMKAKAKKGLFKFLINRDPRNTIFLYGRPLWGSMYNAMNANQSAAPQDLVELARAKLILADNWTANNVNKQAASLAILAVTTNLLNHLIITDQELRSNLIARYMGTLFHYSEKSDTISFRYVSEPILADAAAYYMSDPTILIDILSELNKLLTTCAVESTGLIGELVTEIVFLTARYKALKDNYPDQAKNGFYSQPITVRQFLNALIGDFEKLNRKKDKTKHISDRFLNGILVFTRFIKKVDTLKQRGLMMHLLGRNAALRCRDNFPGIDHNIPTVFPDDSLGNLCSQTKNNINLTTSASLKPVAEKTNPQDIFKNEDYSNNMHTATDINFDTDDVETIVLNFAETKNPQVYVHEHNNRSTFIISGLNSTVYPCLKSENGQIVQLLKQIINSSRYTKKAEYNSEVFQCVTDDISE